MPLKAIKKIKLLSCKITSSLQLNFTDFREFQILAQFYTMILVLLKNEDSI